MLPAQFINSIFQTVLKCLNAKGKVKEKKYDIVTTYVKFGPGSVLDPPHYLLHCTKSVGAYFQNCKHKKSARIA